LATALTDSTSPTSWSNELASSAAWVKVGAWSSRKLNAVAPATGAWLTWAMSRVAVVVALAPSLSLTV
jgi:hypothetical protein